jgi:hypothetical protein
MTQGVSDRPWQAEATKLREQVAALEKVEPVLRSLMRNAVDTAIMVCLDE